MQNNSYNCREEIIQTKIKIFFAGLDTSDTGRNLCNARDVYSNGMLDSYFYGPRSLILCRHAETCLTVFHYDKINNVKVTVISIKASIIL
jgi:hypothetical protein